MVDESIKSRPWTNKNPPKRILIIRFYALGDLTITFPYILGLKHTLPGCTIDLLTTDEHKYYVQSLEMFDRVLPIYFQRKTVNLAYNGIVKSIGLKLEDYDVVIDLQNNWISRTIRRILNPKSYSSFDRFSPLPAGERVANTINAIGVNSVQPDFKLKSSLASQAKLKLMDAGWNEENKLVILNPAGYFETRNWPLDNYISFAQKWISIYPKTQFLLVGIDRIRLKAETIENSLKGNVINLVNQTTISEAFAMVQMADLMLSEDSGLMHMAWVNGVPTIALFGSSRSDWSRPLGDHSICLNSSDLACGECMSSTCKYGDVRCLTRYNPQMVVEKAIELYEQAKS